MKKYFLLLLLLLSSIAQADTLHLKNGGKVECKIISETETSVTVIMKTGGMVTTFKKEEIKEIEKGDDPILDLWMEKHTLDLEVQKGSASAAEFGNRYVALAKRFYSIPELKHHALPLLEKAEALGVKDELLSMLRGKKDLARLEKERDKVVNELDKEVEKQRRKYISLGGRYYRIPEFDWTEHLAKKYRTIDRADIGLYGNLLGIVFQVVNQSEMLVKSKNQLIMVAGYSTANYVDGKGFVAPVAIIGTRQYQTVDKSTNTVYLAVPVSIAYEGITSDEYIAMMNKKVIPEGIGITTTKKDQATATPELTLAWDDMRASNKLTINLKNGKHRAKWKIKVLVSKNGKGCFVERTSDAMGSFASQKWSEYVPMGKGSVATVYELTLVEQY